MAKITKTVLIGKETTWGTAVTPDKDLGIIKSITDTVDRTVNQSQGLTSIEVQKITSGIVDPKLSINFEYQHGRVLEYAFGTVAHAETTGDWKHTFTINDDAPSCTIESSEPQTTNTVMTYDGMLLNSLTISSELNGILTCSSDWVGRIPTSSESASTAVESSLNNFPHALVNVSLNGVQASICQSVSITITKDAQRMGGLGSNYYQKGKASKCYFSYKAKLGFTDKTYQELFLGGATPAETSDPTVYDFLLDANNGVALGSGNRRLYVELENCISQNFVKTAEIGGFVFIELSGNGTLKEAYSVDNISSSNW